LVILCLVSRDSSFSQHFYSEFIDAAYEFRFSLLISAEIFFDFLYFYRRIRNTYRIRVFFNAVPVASITKRILKFIFKRFCCEPIGNATERTCPKRDEDVKQMTDA